MVHAYINPCLMAEAKVVSKDVVLLPPALASLKRFVKMQISGPL